ncbi:hypothetical protein LshimejAT787_0205230 [Lyophyllum shimeji]|uniref:Uncharacterized protein n=1 Tax=Lyophyllum shimeji TaxID=47721 RepID=A0A9P3UIV7_LYOSH|nr:hypothetical protein LshimejAT787_0205230 [Lyophyllum shimeji]
MRWRTPHTTSCAADHSTSGLLSLRVWPPEFGRRLKWIHVSLRACGKILPSCLIDPESTIGDHCWISSLLPPTHQLDWNGEDPDVPQAAQIYCGPAASPCTCRRYYGQPERVVTAEVPGNCAQCPH